MLKTEASYKFNLHDVSELYYKCGSIINDLIQATRMTRLNTGNIVSTEKHATDVML